MPQLLGVKQSQIVADNVVNVPVEVRAALGNIVERCQDVKDGMNYLQSVCPEELQDLLTYFNSTYVSGNFCTIQIPGQIGEEQPPLRLRM